MAESETTEKFGGQKSFQHILSSWTVLWAGFNLHFKAFFCHVEQHFVAGFASDYDAENLESHSPTGRKENPRQKLSIVQRTKCPRDQI